MFKTVIHLISRLTWLIACVLVALPAKAGEIDLSKSAARDRWKLPIKSAAIYMRTGRAERCHLALPSGCPIRGEEEL